MSRQAREGAQADLNSELLFGEAVALVKKMTKAELEKEDLDKIKQIKSFINQFGAMDATDQFTKKLFFVCDVFGIYENHKKNLDLLLGKSGEDLQRSLEIEIGSLNKKSKTFESVEIRGLLGKDATEAALQIIEMLTNSVSDQLAQVQPAVTMRRKTVARANQDNSTRNAGVFDVPPTQGTSQLEELAKDVFTFDGQDFVSGRYAEIAQPVQAVQPDIQFESDDDDEEIPAKPIKQSWIQSSLSCSTFGLKEKPFIVNSGNILTTEIPLGKIAKLTTQISKQIELFKKVATIRENGYPNIALTKAKILESHKTYLENLAKLLSDKSDALQPKLAISKKLDAQFDLDTVILPKDTNPIKTLTTPQFIKWHAEMGDEKTMQFFTNFSNPQNFGGHTLLNEHHLNIGVANSSAQEETALYSLPIVAALKLEEMRQGANKLIPFQLVSRDELSAYQNPAPVIISGIFGTLAIDGQNSIPSGGGFYSLTPENLKLQSRANQQPFNMLVMAANPAQSYQYGNDDQESVQSLFGNAVAAFIHAKEFAAAKGKKCHIVSGLFGAGVFGNSPEFSIAMQYLAAKIAGVDTIEFRGISQDKSYVVEDLFLKIDELLERNLSVNDIISNLLNEKSLSDNLRERNPQGGGWLTNYKFEPKTKEKMKDKEFYDAKAKLLTLCQDFQENNWQIVGFKPTITSTTSATNASFEVDDSILNATIPSAPDQRPREVSSFKIGTQEITPASFSKHKKTIEDIIGKLEKINTRPPALVKEPKEGVFRGAARAMLAWTK